eukprot:TRINITY_DN76497_c0_g1_i1.p1 TRINITY_DN76497_c0_g1~~TRINITY_DN76497_c0_g1_i1.p1  ORF type:complete len:312 (+),score=50.48 TRINITY_DN76497_c0_g1_i1:99-1034(+)
MTLLERFGGELEVEEFVGIVYDKMAQSQDLKRFFARFNLSNLKSRTVDYLGTSALGGFGTDPWTGPDLFASHMSMGVSTVHYDTFMRMTRETLRMKPAWNKVAKEVMKKFEDMRMPIVDPDRKLLKEAQDKLAKQMALYAQNEVDPSGFGMSISRETVAKWEAADKERKDREQRLAELRRKREMDKKEGRSPSPRGRSSSPKGSSPRPKNRSPSQNSRSPSPAGPPLSSTNAPTWKRGISDGGRCRILLAAQMPPRSATVPAGGRYPPEAAQESGAFDAESLLGEGASDAVPQAPKAKICNMLQPAEYLYA